MRITEYYKERKRIKAEKKDRQSKTVRILKSIGGIILYILFIVALIWGAPKALSYFLEIDTPMAAITSGSMWPELKKGDLIFVEGVTDPKNNIQLGDIVVFVNKINAYTIHRVIKLNEETLVTKGDANNIDDEPIAYEDIVGRLYKIGDRNARIPKLGFISTTFSKFANQPTP